jgi:hypothetical protein
LVNQVLVKEYLSDVPYCPTSNGVVGKMPRAKMGDIMVMRGASIIVAREESIKCDNTICVGFLNATKESAVSIAQVIRVPITVCNQAGVNPSSVAAPDFSIETRNGFARFDVNILLFKKNWNSGLSLADLRPDSLAGYPIWTGFSLGSGPKDASLLGRVIEEFIRRYGRRHGVGCLMRFAEHGIDVSGDQLSTVELDCCLTARFRTSLKATGL